MKYLYKTLQNLAAFYYMMFTESSLQTAGEEAQNILLAEPCFINSLGYRN